jgi:NAD(P)-dependent dehydrogenase (short-subunit alcohol dehydrogenase family)
MVIRYSCYFVTSDGTWKRRRAAMGDRLRGKVAVITGSGGLSLGQGCALAFAREGAQVIGCNRKQPGADETCALLESEGLTCDGYCADLTDPAANEALMSYVVGKYGGIDVLLNAAAFVEFVPIEEMDYEKHWKRTIQGELDLVFLACKAAWPHFKARGGGAIINFGSANAHMAVPLAALAHCASKGGVVAMTRQLAAEGAPHNIRANTISPALTMSTQTRGPIECVPGFLDDALRLAMIKRLGTPGDIGHLAVYLASDESSWVTGADYRIDGGTTAW